MTEPNETTVEYWNEMICNDSLTRDDSPEQFIADCQSLMGMLEAHIDFATCCKDCSALTRREL